MKLLSTFLFSMLVLIAVIFTSCSKDSDSKPNKPSARFSANVTSIAKGGTVTFTNTSTNATDYLWKFGDGTSTSVASPSHTYDSIGNFNVTLIALGSGGRDTLSLTVTVASNNITIFDGIGIREANINDTWGSISSKYYLDTTCSVYYNSVYHRYEHEVVYGDSILYAFITLDSVLKPTDRVNDILVMGSYPGTTQNGVALYDYTTSMLAYYGAASSITHNSSNTYTYYEYPASGLVFISYDKYKAIAGVIIFSPTMAKSAPLLPRFRESLFLK